MKIQKKKFFFGGGGGGVRAWVRGGVGLGRGQGGWVQRSEVKGGGRVGGGGGVGFWGQGGYERRSKVFVKIQKKN